MSGSEEDNPLKNHRIQMEVSPVSYCSKLDKPDQEIDRVTDQNSNKNINSESSGGRTELINEPNLKCQVSLQNVCSLDVEVLASKKSELLVERYGLLDDLSEMAESLDDLESEQGRLEQAAVRINALRKALHAAEISLHKQMTVAQSLDHRLYDSHSAVTTRYANIERLEGTLQHASYEIPTNAQKLMFKKVKQVREKIDKVKRKRSIINCLIKNPDTTKQELTKIQDALRHTLLMRKLDPQNDEVMNNLWLHDPNTSRLDALPMRDPAMSSSNGSDTLTLLSCNIDSSDKVMDLLKPCNEDQEKRLRAFNMTINSSNLAIEKLHSEKETLNTDASMSKPPELETCHSSLDTSNSSFTAIQSPQPHSTSDQSGPIVKDTSSTFKSLIQLVEEKDNSPDDFLKKDNSKDPCSCKRSITELENISEGTITKKPHLAGDEIMSNETKSIFPDSTRNTGRCESIPQQDSKNQSDVSHQSGISKPSKSKLSYKSVLQCRGPSSRVDKSPSGQAILCPYDLTGKCQDKQCKFQHFH